MSFLFFGKSRQLARILSAVVVLSCIIGLTPVTANAVAAGRVGDQIAQAKAKVFGEFPKAEKAWPEIVRPDVKAPETTEEKETPATTETQSTVSAPETEAKAKPVKEVVPVEKKTETPAETQEKESMPTAAAEVKEGSKPAPAAEVEKAQPTPAATVEAAVVSAPAPVATEAPAAVETTGDYWVDEILRLVNEARAAEGLSALTINSKAQEAAAIRVVELPSSPSPHLRPDGAQFYIVFADVELKPKTGGENYAIGTANAYSPEQIVNAWMNSPGHRKNIMNASYKQIGIGHAIIGDKEYFEQLFIG